MGIASAADRRRFLASTPLAKKCLLNEWRRMAINGHRMKEKVLSWDRTAERFYRWQQHERISPIEADADKAQW